MKPALPERVTMDRLTGLQLFVRVVETGSFSKAAAKLSLSQPTVTKHISAIERQLGVRLLNRNSRGISLSEIGTAISNASAFTTAAPIPREPPVTSATRPVRLFSAMETPFGLVRAGFGSLIPISHEPARRKLSGPCDIHEGFRSDAIFSSGFGITISVSFSLGGRSVVPTAALTKFAT
jgi:hypothetical protein